MKLRDIFPKSERKLTIRLFLLLLSGIIVHSICYYFLLDLAKEELKIRTIISVFQEIGNSLLISFFVVLVLDLGMRKEFIEDVQNIFTRSQASNFVKSFYSKRKSYSQIFSNSIVSSKKGSKIDVIGVSQRLFFADQPGLSSLEEKIMSGVHFRILILHPKSSIIPLIENLSKDYGFNKLNLSISDVIEGKIKVLSKNLANHAKNKKIKGSIEVRLIKNDYSTLCYHSINDEVILGIYYSHISGTESPAFQLHRREDVKEAKKHFEKLWENSLPNQILLISKDEIVDKANDYE